MTGHGHAARSSAKDDERRNLASRLATELWRTQPAAWPSSSHGAAVAERARVDDDLVLAEAVADAWDLARSAPDPDLVWSQTGPGGLVVVAHGPHWSLVARAGGPVLVLADNSQQVARIDGDPTLIAELDALISELIAASRGEPPFDHSTIPPPPPMPWHRPGWNPRQAGPLA
jgi:hypothetical protein